jgi:phosphoenolpyruvate carboxykinase (GTP)
MLEGETIIGDDIVYLRRKNGCIRAVNVERGIFGIIQGINSKDDPLQWKVLTTQGEVIFSNVLVTFDKQVYWTGKDGPIPSRGYNHSGKWFLGKKDANGLEIPCSHPNARFTFALDRLENCDPMLEAPEGVIVGAIVYGGRDSDTWPPVEESFDWVHGIITKGASLESETTAATLGRVGVRTFNPMSNLDFLSIPIGEYIKNNLNFGKDLEKPPRIFSVNYFLKGKQGNFLNEKLDKKIWYKWMELRVHNDVDAIKTPTGLIPLYHDLKQLFKKILGKKYSEREYITQFTVRIPENLAKINRITKIYRNISNVPKILFKVLSAQKSRLYRYRKKFGDYISPQNLV